MKNIFTLALALLGSLITMAQSEVIFFDEFNSNSQFLVTDKGETKLSLSNGKYIIERSSSENWGHAWIGLTLFDSDEFSIEASAKNIGGALTFGYGILLDIDPVTSSQIAFGITPEGSISLFYFNGTSWENLYPWSKTDAIVLGAHADNILKISKQGNIYYLFVNNKLVTRARAPKYSGTRVGLFVNGNQKVEFDYLKVTLTNQTTPFVAESEKVQEVQTLKSVIKSDVDENIPVNTSNKAASYALIIGNEDYSSFQKGLSTESNVDFAVHDANMFKEYCEKTLGIPQKQIKLLNNATSGQMNQGLAWLANLAKLEGGNAEIIFYYSGHGLPDEQTKEPYLIPVDISGAYVNQGIKLDEVYKTLSQTPTKRTIVFLDACFSGGARNQGLIALKGVKIKPVTNQTPQNMVVFASSTGEESSGVYREKQHGYMTYFLLKKLNETKGNITYQELGEYIIKSVAKETAIEGKIQTPQVNFSPELNGIWEKWKVY